MFHLDEQTAIKDRQLKQLREYQCLEQTYNLILLGLTWGQVKPY